MKNSEFLYHISNTISVSGIVLKPHRNVDTTQKNEDEYIFSSSKPAYNACFKNENTQFRSSFIN